MDITLETVCNFNRLKMNECCDNEPFPCVFCSLSVSDVSPSSGNTMTVSYMTGLMVGSVVAYAAYSFTSPQAGARLPALNVHISANGTGY